MLSKENQDPEIKPFCLHATNMITSEIFSAITEDKKSQKNVSEETIQIQEFLLQDIHDFLFTQVEKILQAGITREENFALPMALVLDDFSKQLTGQSSQLAGSASPRLIRR